MVSVRPACFCVSIITTSSRAVVFSKNRDMRAIAPNTRVTNCDANRTARKGLVALNADQTKQNDHSDRVDLDLNVRKVIA
jgi:hypothetical protein